MPVAFRLLLLLLFLGPALLRAQVVPPAQLRFQHLTVNDGLSHSDAMAVTQDKAGFIWVGTNRGVDRYDGYGLRQYQLPITAKGLPGNRVSVMYAALNGTLWVGTEWAGLSYYDAATDQLRPLESLAAPAALQPLLRQLAGASITALASDAQGGLWISAWNTGLFRLRLGAPGQLAELRAVPLPTGTGPKAIPSALAIDAEGNVWVGTINRGLCRVRRGGFSAEATELTNAIRTLHLDRRGDLWLGLNQQVRWLSAANRRAGHVLAAQLQPLQYPEIENIYLDSFGRLWVGTIYGLYVWEAGPATGFNPPLRPSPTLLQSIEGDPTSLSSERIQQLFEDRTQVLWVCASAGGLNWADLHQKPFGWLHRQPGGQPTLPNNYVNTIYKEEATNTLWLGTRNGLAAYDLSRHTYRTYLSGPTPSSGKGIDVSACLQTHDGTFWIGSHNQRPLRLRRTGLRGELALVPDPPSGPGLRSLGSVEQLIEDGNGTLWAATYSWGLYRLSANGQVLGHYRAGQHGLPTSNFTYLLYDARRDVLWASTRDQGLLELRVGGSDSLRVLRHFSFHQGAADGLRANFVWPLLLDQQGTLWIGTIGGGLHHLPAGAATVWSDRRYLPETDVESLLADDSGDIWIGGTGLYRYNPASHQYVHYDVTDGLQSNAFKVGSMARGADGTLYFGGIDGVNYFRPAAVQPNQHPPTVLLTGLNLNNQPVKVGQEVNGRVVLTRPLTEPQQITLKSSENDFSVEFVGLNYANPRKTIYAYCLNGYHSGWLTPLPGQRTASFANLPPGRYTLRLRASNGEGVWSAAVAPLTIEVLAPWYKTGWANVLYVLALTGAVILYRRVEMGQQELKNKLALEQFQAEKDKELTTLKLGFFTNISHELRTPLTLILGPMEELMRSESAPGLRARLHLMHQQARKLLELVNQLLDFRKVEAGHIPLRASQADLRPWLAEQYAAFEPKARERGTTYVLDAPPGPLLLYFDRSKLEIVLTNLLANAFNYVRDQGRVELTASVIGQLQGEAVYQGGELTGNYLKITVSDNGVGIAPHELGRIFDPYYQAAHTNTRRMTGSGIGLALARQFAERHGGQLTVASTQGVGTTFELRLPLGSQHLHPEDVLPPAPPIPEVPAEEPATPEPAVEELAADPDTLDPTGPAGLPHLLIIEDHEDVRDYLRQLFEADYAVTTAEDGLAGWEATQTRLPDLIISDVMMPRSDGLELCQRLKQHPKTSHIPVLLLTARTAETHQLEGLGLGADDYVSKPFAPTLLQARVEALLRNRRKLHEFYQRNILLQPTDVVVADADREFLEKAMRIVEARFHDHDLSVLVLVREMAMSQSAFYRRIKSLTGQTAVEFIRDVRLKRAAQLLASSQLLVSEVAYEVGIEDPRYFSRMFQKLFGQTPSDYARQHRQGPAGSGS